MNEIWKPIVGYEGLYEVSNIGRVRSLNYNGTGEIKIMKPGISKNGYLQVLLYINGKRKMYKVHRLVAQAFIPNPDNKPQINHKSEDKTLNTVDNLEWTTAKENTNWGTCIKRRSKSKFKPIKQMNLDGTLVTIWPSASNAGEYGFDCGSICLCCQGKLNTHKGYKWAYE